MEEFIKVMNKLYDCSNIDEVYTVILNNCCLFDKIYLGISFIILIVMLFNIRSVLKDYNEIVKGYEDIIHYIDNNKGY